jgi:mRNA interferase HigB
MRFRFLPNVGAVVGDQDSIVNQRYRRPGVGPKTGPVFNIAGNKYRIVVWINYPYRVVYIRFVGTHRQYDSIDAQTV